MAKKYEELTFTDDFMFCKVLTADMELTRRLLELLLGIRIREVRLTEKQKQIDLTSEGRGVRLDVYVQDDKDTVFDVEMQTTKMDAPGKRTRYYQGMIDLNLLEKGELFTKLRQTYIVFICMSDPFKKNLPVYTFESRCLEDLSLPLGDEARKVFINPEGRQEELSDEMKAFFTYLRTGKAGDALTDDIDRAVNKAREHVEWRTEYMTLLLRDAEKRAEGRDITLDIIDRRAEYPDESIEETAKAVGCAAEDVSAVVNRRKKTWRNA